MGRKHRRFPHFKEAMEAAKTVVLKTGDVLFVPVFYGVKLSTVASRRPAVLYTLQDCSTHAEVTDDMYVKEMSFIYVVRVN
jgi:hypothetical protein